MLSLVSLLLLVRFAFACGGFLTQHYTTNCAPQFITQDTFYPFDTCVPDRSNSSLFHTYDCKQLAIHIRDCESDTCNTCEAVWDAPGQCFMQSNLKWTCETDFSSAEAGYVVEFFGASGCDSTDLVWFDMMYESVTSCTQDNVCVEVHPHLWRKATCVNVPAGGKTYVVEVTDGSSSFGGATFGVGFILFMLFYGILGDC